MMKFDPKDAKILREIGVVTTLDLALCLPKKFEDYTLTKEPKVGICTIEIKTTSIKFTTNLLIVSAFCKTWNTQIKIVIFNSRPWHYKVFAPNLEMFICGKADFVYDYWNFANPKIITKPNTIDIKYKLEITDQKISKFIEKYITKENLIEAGLNETEVKALLKIHKGDHESVEILRNLEQNDEILQVLKFVEIYNYIAKLRAKKFHFEAEKVEIYDINPWLNFLPFEPTDDQISALRDIRNDFLSNRAAKRVVMGDVGSGKTLVILGASLMIYPKIAILMAPTTILAEQIYTEATRLLPKFMKIMLLKSGQKNANFEGFNLIIGTHALLYQELPKANLVMVDEQHRFGSNQRQLIDNLTANGDKRAHFLQFSATPIPRTLSLIESELVSFSFLKQMPYKKNIQTIIFGNAGFNDLLEHIKTQISKKKQVIIIYPLVEESEVINYQSLTQAKDFWISKFDKVYITHGSDKDKDIILNDFKENGNILLTTTIVEVGISLPNLTTIIVVGAERLGLATLHQLRGRVGRLGGDGWCFLYTKLKETPKRLIEFSKTNDGFKVAKIDLQNRQAGDILNGVLQHGETFKFYNMEEHLAEIAKLRLKNS